MGVTFDIGEDRLEIAHAIADELGIDLHDTDAYGWCYPHDNNTLFDYCSMCPESGKEPLAEFPQRCFDGFEEWLGSDWCEDPDWQSKVAKIAAIRTAWNATRPLNRAERRAKR